jgi:hypothetical protein
MKKEYSIVFEAPGLGGTINLHPYTDKKYATAEDAEKAIEHLLTGQGLQDKMFYVLPCYSKA